MPQPLYKSFAVFLLVILRECNLRSEVDVSSFFFPSIRLNLGVEPKRAQVSQYKRTLTTNEEVAFHILCNLDKK